MDESKKEYLRQLALYEEKVFGLNDKIKFIESLSEIIANHSEILTKDELVSAQILLVKLKQEICNSTF